MENLKTLKDLEVMNYLETENSGAWVGTNELRQEAIKWYKYLKNTKKEEALHLWNTFFWIEGFFNITEEDLK